MSTHRISLTKLIEICASHGWNLYAVFEGEGHVLVKSTEEALSVAESVDDSSLRFKSAEGKIRTVYWTQCNEWYESVIDCSESDAGDWNVAMREHDAWVDSIAWPDAA